MTNPTTQTWHEQGHFAGLDWARSHHDVIILDQHGSVQEKLPFEHSAEGWEQLRALVARHPRLPIAVETSQGTVVEQLLACGARVYPVNPKAAQRYRERHAPSGVKDDERDAWSLADALRLDGAAWRELVAQDPLVAELRLLCRDEIALIEQRTAFINQLRQCLHEYYPAALEAFDDWTCPGAWAFVLAFPSAPVLTAAGRHKWEKFLHTHKLWRSATVEARLAIFARAEALSGNAPTTAAKSLLAVSLARLLQTIEHQLDTYRERIAATFARHPDHDLFGSLPGAGEKLAPRLLAEIGARRAEFACAESLQCLGGTAPLTIKTGKTCYQRVRHACNDTLRATVHLWADHSRTKCAWAEAYYQKHRADGQSHACALRCLGQRWLKIFWKMWQTRTPYDEALHTRNQTRHGSWVLSLQPA
jgi:transposase/transposase IS116/IS110/IS902 family protein